jgi:hypothetical protein
LKKYIIYSTYKYFYSAHMSAFMITYHFLQFVRFLKNSFHLCYDGTCVSNLHLYTLYKPAERKRWYMQWLSTTLFAPDPKQPQKRHGSAKKHQRYYRFMEQCIRRINKERGAIEAITAQFQSAAFQCPDSIPKRRLCLAFVNAVHESLPGGWN